MFFPNTTVLSLGTCNNNKIFDTLMGFPCHSRNVMRSAISPYTSDIQPASLQSSVRFPLPFSSAHGLFRPIYFIYNSSTLYKQRISQCKQSVPRLVDQSAWGFNFNIPLTYMYSHATNYELWFDNLNKNINCFKYNCNEKNFSNKPWVHRRWEEWVAMNSWTLTQMVSQYWVDACTGI